jgi:hypothetical protein
MVGRRINAGRRFAAVTESGSIQTLLCEAIRKHFLLEFEYDDRLRVVAPYCYGLSTRGEDVLRAIQVRGGSAEGGYGFGKIWTVAKIKKLQMLEEVFVLNDPLYNPQDSAMTRIYCRV